MKINEIRVVHDSLKALYDAELAMAEFYKTCGEAWENELGFWWKMAAEETQHAANLIKMANIITEKPLHFELGNPIDVDVVNGFVAEVNDRIKNMKEGKISRDEILPVVRELMRSIIEFEYHEIVKAEDREYQGLMGEIVSQTVSHKNTIERKIITENKKGKDREKKVYLA